MCKLCPRVGSKWTTSHGGRTLGMTTNSNQDDLPELLTIVRILKILIVRKQDTSETSRISVPVSS